MKKKSIYILGVVVLIVFIAFGYYAVSPLFKNIKVDEEIPKSERVIPPTSTEDINPTEETFSKKESVAVSVIGTSGHPASGTVRVITADGKTYIRYEDFKTINGPDIYVYLAKDLDAKEFVNVARVKATEGNINYEVPAGVDVAQYRYIITWCKTFGVLFNYADLSQAQ